VKLTMRLTLDGLVRALRGRAHDWGERPPVRRSRRRRGPGAPPVAAERPAASRRDGR